MLWNFVNSSQDIFGSTLNEKLHITTHKKNSAAVQKYCNPDKEMVDLHLQTFNFVILPEWNNVDEAHVLLIAWTHVNVVPFHKSDLNCLKQQNQINSFTTFESRE